MPEITSADVGHPTAAGEYQINGTYYEVSKSHILTWKKNPAAKFWTILRTRINDKALRFVLGAPVEK